MTNATLSQSILYVSVGGVSRYATVSTVETYGLPNDGGSQDVMLWDDGLTELTWDDGLTDLIWD